MGEEDQKKFATAHRNAWLVDFKRAFAARDAKWQAQVAAALVRMSGHFRDLDRRLATNDWLIDGSFTLADVAWTPQVHRMSLMEWPMASYPHLSRWYAQLQKLPSFQEAVVDYEPPGAQAMFCLLCRPTPPRTHVSRRHVEQVGSLVLAGIAVLTDEGCRDIQREEPAAALLRTSISCKGDALTRS